MRLLVNLLIALMLLGILTGVMVHRGYQQQEQQQQDDARDDVRRLQREVMLQSTLRKVELGESGFPLTINPGWFEEGLPQNNLISQAHPWLEIAHEDHRHLQHPPVKIAAERNVARFWYNPYNGRVRARVPGAMSDAAALRTYNYINDSNVTTLFEDDPAAKIAVP